MTSLSLFNYVNIKCYFYVNRILNIVLLTIFYDNAVNLSTNAIIFGDKVLFL